MSLNAINLHVGKGTYLNFYLPEHVLKHALMHFELTGQSIDGDTKLWPFMDSNNFIFYCIIRAVINMHHGSICDSGETV